MERTGLLGGYMHFASSACAFGRPMANVATAATAEAVSRLSRLLIVTAPSPDLLSQPADRGQRGSTRHIGGVRNALERVTAEGAARLRGVDPIGSALAVVELVDD